MNIPPREGPKTRHMVLKCAKFALALLCFPILGSSCATTDSNAGLSPAEIAQRERFQAKYGHIRDIRSGRIHSIPDSNPSVASTASTIDSIRSIRDPNQRAAANTAWAQSMVQGMNSSMQQAGMNPNQMAYQSNYDAARRRGMTPAEADAEAREFVRMWQMMSR